MQLEKLLQNYVILIRWYDFVGAVGLSRKSALDFPEMNNQT